MSFHINSDKEKIRGVNPKIIGDNEATIRIGTGSDEREVFRAEVDSLSGLPRIGINRTGQRLDRITVVTGGSGYTSVPTVNIDPPPAGGTQALATAFVGINGQVTNVAVNDPGSGYTSAPNVTFSGGGGAGAAATSTLDTVDFELDINGAIRTSTSIISDTARVLNLDIDNFVTPDLELRAPNLKTFLNNTGVLFTPNDIVNKDEFVYADANVYQILNDGKTGSTFPVHTDGIVVSGNALDAPVEPGVQLKHIGYRVQDPEGYLYNQTGNAGAYPRSITPLLGDRSDKIATTEYVLNLATNDVGGRVYVSEQIGSDLNDGRSAVSPVKTIKRAAQIAWSTPGVKETLIVAGGDYVEDNPISLPPDASVVGDNLRLVIIRPGNPGKDIFKFGDKNYVTGVTYRDQVDPVTGQGTATWRYAMVFDDKQRVIIDNEVNGDFGVDFPIGHKIIGPDRFRLTFESNTGLNQLVAGLDAVSDIQGARTRVIAVTFDELTGPSAFETGSVDVEIVSGGFSNSEGFTYYTGATQGAQIGGLTATQGAGENLIRFTTDPTTLIPAGSIVYLDDVNDDIFTAGFYEVTGILTDQAPAYWDVRVGGLLGAPEFSSLDAFTGGVDVYAASATTAGFNSTSSTSIRTEGEVVSTDYDVTSELGITRIDFSLQGDASIATGGFQNEQFGNAEDLGGIVFYTNPLAGASNTHEFKEGQEIELSGLPTSTPDLSFLNGKQRIYKVLEDADGRSRRFVIPKKAPTITSDNFDPGQFAKVKSYAKSITLSLRNSPNKFPLATPVDRRYQDAVTFIRNNRDFIADEVVGKINAEFAKEYYSVYNVSGNSFDIYLGLSAYPHTYVSGGTVTFGGSTVNITGFTWDNSVTGVATVTTATAVGVSEDDTVKLADLLISCANGQKIYPSFSIPVDDEQCRQDIVHFLNALVRDLEFGTNHNIIDAGKKYIVGAKIDYVDNEIIQTVRAIEYVRELAIFAMCNWRTGNRTPSDPVYAPEYSSVARYFDDSVITSTAPDPVTGVACDDVRSAIDTLAYLYIDVVANNTSGTYLDAAYLVARNRDLIADQAYLDTIAAYPSLGLSNVQERKCRRDINLVIGGLIRDLSLGGNSGIVTAAENYYSGTSLVGVPPAQLGATRYAFQKTEYYAAAAMRNWTDGNVLQVTPSTATYNSTTGVVEITIPTPGTLPQGLTQGSNDRIAFAEGAITFNCSSNGGGDHASPDRFDSNFGQSYAIIDVVNLGATTRISCNVGNAGTAAGVAHTFVSALANGTKIIYNPITTTSSIPKFEDWNILTDSSASTPAGIFTPSDATYDPATGDFVLTMNSHGLTTSNSIRLQPESFVFTCTMDGNKTEHALPASGQAAYGNALQITGTTTNTVTVNVGASGSNVQFTPTDATYNPATGALELTIGTHTLDVGEGIVIADNSLSFSCDMDSRDSTKTYPRPGIDPYAGRSMKITSKTATTITVNAGVSAANKYFQPSAVDYNSTTGDMVVTVGQHGLGVGRSVVLEDNSFTFTCDQDGNTTPKTYPRPGTDPMAGKSIEITAVGSTSHTVTDAPYDAAAGVVTLTVAGHGFSNGDYVKVADGSLTYTCVLDGNTVQKTYPRAGYDYPSGRWLEISNVTTNTFDINIGPSSYTGTHTFVSASANGLERQDGTFTINVGNAGTAAGSVHTFVSATAQAIKHEPQSTHYFEGATNNAVSHSPQSVHTFVRTSADSVTAYSSSTPALACANVESTINTEMGLLDGILEYAEDPSSGTAIVPGATTKTFGTLYDTTQIITYPDSYIYDTQGTRMAVRADYDDFPIIEASPYTQNASVISSAGGSGAEIDGNKVKQPNCPFPGLEDDGTASFPNQGKSMVAAAFTIVSQGGTGYIIKNDGYVQLVSVFCIFCQDGVLAESGGYASITNSATNFGVYALRANGFRSEAYTFDQATVQSISQTAAGRTTMIVSGLGRAPLEHYIIKLPGYSTQASNIEFFIDAVDAVSVAAPFTATITLANGDGNDPLTLVRDSDGVTISGLTALQQELTPAGAPNSPIAFHRPSIVNSSSHTWEYAGAGITYNALPENGGTKIEAYEQVDGPNENYGRVYVSGTDELGDFKVGTFARIENRTGAITFTGTVTISEVEFLKLKGGTVVVTGFSADNTLGGANTSDSKLPTQKAVRDFITNNLGAYINKPYSTNAVPRSLVELTDSGKISLDQIPALRPFSVYTVADQAERLSLEGALAGDIAIESDTQSSFILNNDNDSLFLGFPIDPTLTFSNNGVGGVYTGSPTGGRIQATEYREGVVYQLNITNGGSGYTTAPTVTIASPGGTGVLATAVCTIAGGEVVTLTITENAGFYGGKGYTSVPTVTIAAPPGSGTQATADALIESRLYGDIINNIKILDTDSINDDSVPANNININRAINTSAFDIANWVSLSAQAVNIGDLTATTGNVISSTLLGTGSANSFTFLRGDTRYSPAVQTVKGAERRYFAPLVANAVGGSSQLIFNEADIIDDVVIGHEVSESVTGIPANTTVNGIASTGGLTTVALNNPITSSVTITAGTFIEFFRSPSPVKIDSLQTKSDFVSEILIANAGSGYTPGDYRNIGLTGANVGNGIGLEANIVVDSNGTIESVTITNGGANFQKYEDSSTNGDFTVTIPVELGPGSNAVLEAKTTTSTRSHGFVGLDVDRVTDATISADPFGTAGVARFNKNQFEIGANGSVTLKDQSNTIASGLDADLLDGAQGSVYLDGQYFFQDSIGPLQMQKNVDYDFNVLGSSGQTDKVNTITINASSDPSPFEFKNGLAMRTVFDTADGLSTAYPQVVSGIQNANKHLVMTIRTAGDTSTVDGGGVRQLAFANDDNIYLRGSGAALNQFANWAKIWTSENDGPGNAVSGRGPDADLLDGKQGTWYQQPWNLNINDPKTNDPQQLWETYLPRFLDTTKFRNKIEIKSFNGTDTSYRIFFRDVLDISATGIFRPSYPGGINLYDITGANNVGDFFVDNAIQHIDANDANESYTILEGRLASGGSFTNAVFVGTANIQRRFEAYALNEDNNMYTTAEIGNASGDGFVRLGRRNNIASTPYIHFNSSAAPALDNNNAPTFNSAIVASGGNANEGSGSINIIVVDENALTVNSSIIWNASNVIFNSLNVASTASLKSAVMRDTNGDFAAGTITAALTGAASDNVLKTGDTMVGALLITNVAEADQALSVSGRSDFLASVTVEDDLTVNAGTLYVDSTNAKVTVGSTTSGPSTFNVSSTDGSLAFVANKALAEQTSQYKFTIWTNSTGGESGMVLRHGTTASNPAEWGISTERGSANVGDLIFRTKTGTSSNAERFRISNSGDTYPGTTETQHLGTVSKRWATIFGAVVDAKDAVKISDASGNNGAELQFLGAGSGAGGGRNWRFGNALNSGADVFEISASDSIGGVDWRTALSPTPGAPAIAIDGATNAVAINTDQFSGTDTSQSPNVQRNYVLNIEGDMNLNGNVYQNNEEFVTSRWTEASTNLVDANVQDIYRLTAVGINQSTPAYILDVNGDINTNAKVRASGDAQWLDTYGVMKANRLTIDEDITIPASTGVVSAGDIVLNTGRTITISTGSTWSIV